MGELGYGESGSGDKIKGGDMLIFRMEMLKIKGNSVRAAKCNLKTGEDCDESEAKILAEWGKKPVQEIADKMKALKKMLDGTLKSDVRKETQALHTMLKKIKK